LALGYLALLDRPTVAIVGTRRATGYAERVTRQLAMTLARAGACVISGLARGVDAAAHRGALEVDGATIAVLGTGLDVCYPRGHASLQRDIGARGLLLSELPPTMRRTEARSRSATASSRRSRAPRSSWKPA
jgi:DNA processing protein